MNNYIKDNYFYRSDINRLVSKNTNLPDYNLKNESSIYIIERLIKGETVEEISTRMSIYFNVDYDLVKQDVIDFINNIMTYRDVKKHNDENRKGIPLDIEMENIEFPLSIEIELTKRCNWKCKFCYNVWKHNEALISRDIDLNFDKFKKLVNEVIDNGCNLIRLSGGEPTLHPEFFRMLEYASNKGCKIALFSNGTSFSDEYILSLRKYNIIKILLSLHGLKKQHDNFTGIEGSYEYTISTIKKLIDVGFDICVETILTRKMDEDYLDDMAKILKNIGVHNWSFMPYVETGTESIDKEYIIDYEQADEIIRKIRAKYGLNIRVVCSQKLCLEKYGNYSRNNFDDNSYIDGNCGSGVLWLSVSHDGKIRNCPHSDLYAGTIDDGIKLTYKNVIKPEVMRIYSSREEKCVGCEVYASCRGGCHLGKIRY